MGLFGFLGKLGSATVKTVVTPLQIVKDTFDGDFAGAQGGYEDTGDLIESALDDVDDSIDELFDDEEY
jgi:hypothetical protein